MEVADEVKMKAFVLLFLMTFDQTVTPRLDWISVFIHAKVLKKLNELEWLSYYFLRFHVFPLFSSDSGSSH